MRIAAGSSDWSPPVPVQPRGSLRQRRRTGGAYFFPPEDPLPLPLPFPLFPLLVEPVELVELRSPPVLVEMTSPPVLVEPVVD